MSDVKIEVICYSGYRTEERPRTFIIHNEKIEIAEILDMWIEEGIYDKVRKTFFKVKGRDGSIHKIYLVEKTREWFVCNN